MTSSPTIQDVLDAMQIFSAHVDEQFVEIRRDISVLKKEVADIQTTMVTKEEFNKGITDLRGDFVVLVRKEDRKFGALVDELLQRKVLDPAAAQRILGMEPFAQTNG